MKLNQLVKRESQQAMCHAHDSHRHKNDTPSSHCVIMEYYLYHKYSPMHSTTVFEPMHSNIPMV